ncbi:MAG: alpha-amylase [Candidatus Contendobacter odensis]|uniref:Alpha-amylase n=1 Tax=Candidatus Contendibacter odensensis TaxID=1400860 RepID=A0A2G6PEE3_9GAMM|nr:MAG: alpha-amylase [Candidatus Contendobacter odensis]
MLIYNLFPLLAGHCENWEPHFKRAADMGFDWVFVNSVQKPGYSGSLYSIVDYFQLNPLIVDAEARLSPEKQLKAALSTADSLGLKVMVDLVINHCAFDADLTHQHPEWFVHEEDGSIAHPFCMEDGHKVVWGDLALFNHEGTSDQEGLYQYFYKIVQYLLDLGFKGFRCDAAYQIPGHTWSRLIKEVRQKYPDTLFTAETLGCTADQTKQTALAGFDYVFNSSKWWDFHGAWLMEQYQLVRETTLSISFPESHDTERLFQEVDGNVEAMKQRYLFAALFSAGSMIPMGFEFGFRRRLHVVETRPNDWEQPNIDLREFITAVNTVKRQYVIFQEECPTTLLPYQNPNILLMWKASAKTQEEALIILNKDPWNHQYFYADNLGTYIQAGAPLQDVSPEYPLEYIPKPFSYDLRPGQAFVMVASRDHHK